MKRSLALGAAFVVMVTTASGWAQIRCAVENDFPAAPSRHSAKMTFHNAARGDRQLFWLNFEGQRVHKATLRPGQDFTADTFVGHPWVATDGAANCRAVYFPDSGRARLIELID